MDALKHNRFTNKPTAFGGGQVSTFRKLQTSLMRCLFIRLSFLWKNRFLQNRGLWTRHLHFWRNALEFPLWNCRRVRVSVWWTRTVPFPPLPLHHERLFSTCPFTRETCANTPECAQKRVRERGELVAQSTPIRPFFFWLLVPSLWGRPGAAAPRELMCFATSLQQIQCKVGFEQALRLVARMLWRF